MENSSNFQGAETVMVQHASSPMLLTEVRFSGSGLAEPLARALRLPCMFPHRDFVHDSITHWGSERAQKLLWWLVY